MRGGLDSWIMAVLADVMNTSAASPKSLLGQKLMQLVERIQRHPRRAEFHGRADRRAEHPRGNDDDYPWRDFYVNNLPVGSLLAVLTPHPAAVEGMPAVEDFNFLPDMGGMTRRLLSAERDGYSRAVSWPGNAPRW
jgi:hypothetical protein